MRINEVTSIQINRDTHTKLKVVAALTQKKMYQLIDEATVYLEQKYHIIRSEIQEEVSENV